MPRVSQKKTFLLEVKFYNWQVLDEIFPILKQIILQDRILDKIGQQPDSKWVIPLEVKSENLKMDMAVHWGM